MRRLPAIKRKQPRADGAFVVRRPLAPLREQYQFFPRGDAAFAPSHAPPEFPLLAAEGLPRQLRLARAADFHVAIQRGEGLSVGFAEMLHLLLLQVALQQGPGHSGQTGNRDVTCRQRRVVHAARRNTR